MIRALSPSGGLGGGEEGEGAGHDQRCPGSRELLAVQELWPDVPHQVCQFHALRDASKSAFEADKQVKTAMRKRLQRQQ